VLQVQNSVSRDCLQYFTSTPSCDRSIELNASFLSDAESLFSICSNLREDRNAFPRSALDQARGFFAWIDSNFLPTCFAEERLYFLSELAFTISTAHRWLG